MPIEQARQWAAEHARAAAALLTTAAVEVEQVPDTACVDVQSPGGISVAARVWISGVEVDRALGTLLQNWKARGFPVLDDRHTGPARTLMVMRPADGFLLRATVNLRDELMVTASSPCLWPKGKEMP